MSVACENAHTEIVDLLLGFNADVSQCVGDECETPLHVSCEAGHVEIVRLLLHRNADVSKCDKDGRSPLYVACREGEEEIVRILLRLILYNIQTRDDHHCTLLVMVNIL